MTLAGWIERAGGSVPDRARTWLSGCHCLTSSGLVLADAVTEGPLALGFDGFLTNRDDLAAALGGGAAERLRGAPDAAVALAVAERWGVDGLARLEGQFALAVWDGSCRRLSLATDGMGFQPLFYCHGAEGIAFASDLPVLLRWPGLIGRDGARRIDERRLADDLLFPSGHDGHSYFADIQRVPAATVLTFDGAAVHRRTTWQPDFSRRLSFRSDDEYVEAARAVLDQAVRHCLPSSGPVVSQITGGLDSSAVATTAARLLGGAPLATVTAIPGDGVTPAAWAGIPGRYATEQPFVEAIAAHHANLTAHFRPGAPAHPLETDTERVFVLTGGPRANLMNNLWLLPSYEQVQSLGAREVLSGFLGNLTLSWGGKESAAGLLRGRPLGDRLAAARARAALTGEPPGRLLWRWGIRPGLPRLLDRAILAARRGRLLDGMRRLSALSPEALARLELVEPVEAWARAAVAGGWRQRQWQFENTRRVTHLQATGAALFGVRRRCPFADRRLMEFCFAVPDDQYLRGATTRFLARRTLADRLPGMVLDNQGTGLQSPDGHLRLQRRKPALAEALAELHHSPLATHLLDLPRLGRLMQDWPADPARLDPRYSMVLDRGIHYGQFLRWVERGCPGLGVVGKP